MGIPKFYRWLSERYPLINQPGGASVVPVIDNFYLDMNGIVHNCTHGNDPDTKLTEEEMIKKIFRYLDKLFHIVKPQKLMFMAIDGVAPRAKMNQQRARRFKTAKEAEKRAAEAKENPDEEASKVEPFDSNCITPGTPFMERLASHLRFFIRHKISEDQAWQKPTIVFSGHDVPGEGEHKIMEYLRLAKKNPDYEANTRHCLYGLDADLIMLSLVTHEPHFCLLREIVSYKNKGQPIREALENPSQEHFVLFQIGLLRDYLDLEFQVLSRKIPFQFDMERIIDDFVLFCMLIGNDFLPPLPTCDIGEGSLDLMFQSYKKLLPKLGGYLTHAGSLHRGRLEAFLKELALHEAEVLEHRAQDAEEYESKQKKFKEPLENNGMTTQPLNADLLESSTSELADLSILEKEGHELELLAVAEGEIEPFVEVKKKSQMEPTMMSHEARAFFQQGDRQQGLNAWKERYYREKLKASSPEARREVVESYIQGLHWVLEYYYRGVASWNWYYPYHYAPMASDCTALSDIEVVFSPGKPFLPYEQLMAVQPSSSCKLLPEPYRHLMTDATSPIADFYPRDFAVDLEGKRADWEGVVLIPFINEERLLKAIQSVPTGALTQGEKKRNSEGEIKIFKYDIKSKDRSFCQSTLPGHYADVMKCNSIVHSRPAPPPLPAGEAGFSPDLFKGTRTGVMTVPGFPTLKTLAIYGELEKAGVDVFGMRSRKESLILKLRDITKGIDESLLSAKGISKVVLNQRAWVGWPYVRESIVDKVADENCVITSAGNEQRSIGWDIEVANLKNEYLKKFGVDLGNVQLLLHVRPVEGLIRQVDGSVEKRFGKETKTFPIQMTLRKNPAPDPRFDPQALDSGDDSFIWHSFKAGSKAIYLGKGYYGCTATITDDGPLGRDKSGKPLRPDEKKSKSKRYRVIVEAAPDASSQVSSAAKRLLTTINTQYLPSGKVCRILGISPKALGLISGNFYIRTGNNRNDSIDIGLYVKDGKKSLCVPDYCIPLESNVPDRKGGWGYSDAFISVLKSYKQRYPGVWAALDQEKTTLETLFPGIPREAAIEELGKIKKWLSSLPSARRNLVSTEAKVASDSAISIFQASLPQTGKSQTIIEMENVPPAMLLPPIDAGGLMAIFSGGSFSLGDRVVFAGSTDSPPFGSRGTVVGVHGDFLEVIFDTSFDGANDLGGRCTGNQGAVIPQYALLNLSKPHAIASDAKIAQKTSGTPSKGPRIPDASGAKGFGLGRGRGAPATAVANPLAPGRMAGMQLLGQLQTSPSPMEGQPHAVPPPPPASVSAAAAAPTAPPMPSSSLLQSVSGTKVSSPSTNGQDSNQVAAEEIWKMLGGKK